MNNKNRTVLAVVFGVACSFSLFAQSLRPDERTVAVSVRSGLEYASAISVSDSGRTVVAIKHLVNRGQSDLLLISAEGDTERVPVDLALNGVQVLPDDRLILRGGTANESYVFELRDSSGTSVLWTSADFAGTRMSGAFPKFSANGEQWFYVSVREDFSGFTIYSGTTKNHKYDSYVYADDALLERWHSTERERSREDQSHEERLAWARANLFMDNETARNYVLDSPGESNRLAVQYGGQVYLAERGNRRSSWRVRRVGPLQIPSDLQEITVEGGTGVLLVKRSDGTELFLSPDTSYRELKSSAGRRSHDQLTQLGPMLSTRGSIKFSKSRFGDYMAAMAVDEDGRLVVRRWSKSPK